MWYVDMLCMGSLPRGPNGINGVRVMDMGLMDLALFSSFSKR